MQPSVTFTPTIIHPFPQIDQTLVPVSYCSRRFRKILPKLDPSVQTHQTPEILPSVPNTAIVPQNPYIIIIPRVENTKNQIPNNARLPRVSKRKPILRITINKMYNGNGKEMKNIHNGLDVRKDSSDEEEQYPEQVEIKNHKLNRSVIFSLDPVSGEILVTKRPIRSSAEENHEDKSKVEDSQGIGSPRATEKSGNSCEDPGQQ